MLYISQNHNLYCKTAYKSQMIALGIFILGVLLVTIPVASRPLKAIMFPPEPTPGSLPTHSVRRSHRLSSDPIISLDPSAKHGRLHRHRRMHVRRR
ncbi:unnamed protein product [Penicillium nalgiovense]|nr:unnamed protein product [Penicillium nalgiovense]